EIYTLSLHDALPISFGSHLALPLGFLLVGVATEDARGRELAQLVADHVLGHEDLQVLAAVVDHERQPDELGRDCRAPRPGLDRVRLALAARDALLQLR